MKTKILSVNCNRKLGRKIGIFNLPAGRTCPGRTAECGRICYAMKAERVYPAARVKREKNYQLVLLDKENFVNMITKEILDNKITQVRVHESGDFFSQDYLDGWIRIANACPETTFLAFTKSFHLNFRLAPANLVIFYSIDTSTDMSKVPQDGRHTALTMPKGQLNCSGRHTCPPVGKDPVTLKRDKTHYHYCGESCQFCWNNSGDVCWISH